MAVGRSAPPSELRPDVAALKERGRRIQVIASWTGLGAALLFAFSTAATRTGHLTVSGFGGFLQVPDALTPLLATKKVDLTTEHWMLRTDAELSMSQAWFFFRNIGFVIGVVALFRRQWALAAITASLWVLPYQLITLQTYPNVQAVSAREFTEWKTTYLTPLGEKDKSPDRIYPDDKTEIIPPRHTLTLADAPAGQRGDMAYLLAQVAYINRDVSGVAANLKAMGRDYPQRNRITRGRIQSMNAYIEHKAQLAPPGPPSRAGLPHQVMNPIGRIILLLALIVLLGALATDFIGGRISRRVKRLQRIQAASALRMASA